MNNENIENKPVKQDDSGLPKLPVPEDEEVGGTPIEVKIEGEVHIETYKDGSIIRRDPKTGRWLPGSVSKGGKNKKPYEFWAIAGHVRDDKTLRACIAKLFDIALTSKDPKVNMEAIMNIAKLEGMLRGKSDIDLNVNTGNIDNLNSIINNLFGVKDKNG